MSANNQCKMNKSSIFCKIKSIGSLSVLIFVCMLAAIGSLTLPANAATNEANSVLVSLVSSTSNPAILNPTFDRTKVNLGITPTGWSNSDDLTIDLNPPIPYEQILSEMALSGFKGTQMSPKFPEYPKKKDLLKTELAMRNLRISEPWVGTEFTIGNSDKTFQEFEQQMNFMKDMGGTNIVVAELGGAVHQKKCVDPLVNRPHFTDAQWSDLLKGLNKLGETANKNGMQLVYHPHIGTGVEDMADIDRLMNGTDAKNVKLLLDTGHLYYAGVDPLDVAKKYADRIKHVHLKNIRQSILDESKKTGRSFLDSIREGIFTVPGDPKGAIDFQPILQELATANYEGWLMVEAEQDPNKAEPLKYALMARQYLRDEIGF
ncbi:MAG TPA: myo-inosose-2 dehydratase [Leptolyngbyaceae cyanobacterium]